jgi:uncharacterized membrane protein YoaK (UPF0700 family)
VSGTPGNRECPSQIFYPIPNDFRQVLANIIITLLQLNSMFRQGKPRAFIHNLRLASMLSFVAGVVNIVGVLSISTLTTNVTGHFAFFAEEFVQGNYQMSVTYIMYIMFFLLGAFVCGSLIEIMLKVKPGIAHAIPMLIEMGILILISQSVDIARWRIEWIAGTLLFAMGLQNALVTKISQATVRTTHLTGLFTDLGIELSQLFFHRAKAESKKLSASIYLRLAIITFFFIGGVLGGFLYKQVQLKALLLAATSLFIALLYDNIRLRLHYYLKKLQTR